MTSFLTAVVETVTSVCGPKDTLVRGDVTSVTRVGPFYPLPVRLEGVAMIPSDTMSPFPKTIPDIISETFLLLYSRVLVQGIFLCSEANSTDKVSQVGIVDVVMILH